MKPRKLIYHIFPANIMVTITSVLILAWYGASTIHNFYMDESRDSLLARAHIIESEVINFLKNDDIAGLRDFIHIYGRKTSSRITVISPNGAVLSDSLKNQDRMDNHLIRPEVQEAMKMGTGSSRRFSRTVGEVMLYVAIHLQDKDRLSRPVDLGYLRVSLSVAKLDKTLAKVKTDMLFGIIAVVILAALVTMYVSHRITSPLAEMTKGAERFAVGRFSPHLVPPENVASEIGTLSMALNSMADQIQDRIATILHQKDELQIILDSMLAAVCTIDTDNRIVSLNVAASKLLKLDRVRSVGKSVPEIIRNIDLLRLIENTKRTGESAAGDIVIRQSPDDIYLHANCVHLYHDDDKSFGLLLVLHDVTRLHLLENMRRDFVANVSHELKTPITSIKGYVETILDDDFKDRDNNHRFLEIVLKKANQLNAIIDHLLLLSKIEQQVESDAIELLPENLKKILVEVVHSCTPVAEEKGIKISLECSEDLSVKAHSVLLEQAVVNLVINAVKYSHANGEIRITVTPEKAETGDLVRIMVQDFGVGIGAEHLPRLFERFYRSDKARSRKLGGTGLGLAIVKHIAQAHKGDVEVESTPGEGTRVSIRLPV